MPGDELLGAVDLALLNMEVRPSLDHPEGECTRKYVKCAGCWLLAPLEPGYCGSTVGHCRLCGYSWQVIHHPELCWQ